MTLNNWFLVFMGISYIVPLFFKQYFLVLAFIIYGLCFGFVEFVAAHYTGHTISQQVWDLLKEHHWQGVMTCMFMLMATVFLVLHLMGVGRK